MTYDAERIDSIRGRLKQARCSLCYGWVTPAEQRVPSLSVGDEMCSCPRGVHASDKPDVDDEDVEYLLGEVDRMQRAFVATFARLRSEQSIARGRESRGSILSAADAIGHAADALREEFQKDQ